MTAASRVARGRLAFGHLWGSRLFTRERKGCGLWGGGWAIPPLPQVVSCPTYRNMESSVRVEIGPRTGQGGEGKLGTVG